MELVTSRSPTGLPRRQAGESFLGFGWTQPSARRMGVPVRRAIEPDSHGPGPFQRQVQRSVTSTPGVPHSPDGPRITPTDSGLLPGPTPARVSEVAPWPFTEVDLCQPKHLFRIQVVDVDANVGHQLGGNIPMVLFDVGNPVMGRIGFAFAVTEDEDRTRRRQLHADLSPVGRTVVFVGSGRVPSLMVNLVEPPVGIGCDHTLRPRTGLRICRIDQRIPIGDDGDHILAPDVLLIVLGQRTLGSMVRIAESAAASLTPWDWMDAIRT